MPSSWLALVLVEPDSPFFCAPKWKPYGGGQSFGISVGPSLHGELMYEEEECSELLSSELDREGRRGEYSGERTMKLATQRRWGNLPRPRLPSELR